MSQQDRHLYEFGPFRLDPFERQLTRSGNPIPLTPKAFDTLYALVENGGRLMDKDGLLQRVWPDTFVEEATLAQNIFTLRRALGGNGEGEVYIETVPRRGYRFVEAVRVLPLAIPYPVDTTPHRPFIVPVPTDPTYGEPNGDGEAPSADGRPETARSVSQDWKIALRHLKLKTVIPGVVLLLVLIAGGGWWLRLAQRQSYMIAVIPFKNLSTEPGSDYFSDGLTDETIHNLSLIEGLQVRSRTSSFFFKDKLWDVKKISDELGVNLVLEGSVLREGNRIRVNADLVRTTDDTTLWSGRYDRELQDIFAIQDEISRSIVNELRLKNVGGQRRYNTNLEAYDLYLKAESSARRVMPAHEGELQRALELYQQVVEKDPNFAPAYAEMAAMYSLLSLNSAFPMSFADVHSKMKAAAERSLRLDPLLPEAYEAIGSVYTRELAWRDAEKAFNRAIELNPNSSRLRRDLAMNIYIVQGKYDAAVRELRAGLKSDPLSNDLHTSLAILLISARRYDEAWAECHRALALDPDDVFAKQLLGRLLLLQGKPQEAIAMFEVMIKKFGGGPGEHFLGYAYAQTGRRAEAEQLLKKYAQVPNRQAMIYAGLGDKNKVFESLERMAAKNDFVTDVYPTYPEFELVRSDTRLVEFRQKRGLPPVP